MLMVNISQRKAFLRFILWADLDRTTSTIHFALILHRSGSSLRSLRTFLSLCIRKLHTIGTWWIILCLTYIFTQPTVIIWSGHMEWRMLARTSFCVKLTWQAYVRTHSREEIAAHLSINIARKTVDIISNGSSHARDLNLASCTDNWKKLES